MRVWILALVIAFGRLVGIGAAVVTSDPAGAKPVVYHRETDCAIPDNNSLGVDCTLTIPNPGTLQDLDVAVRIDHSLTADIDMFLIAPDNTMVELVTDQGFGANFGTGAGTYGGGTVYTVFDDSAATSISGVNPFIATFKPEVGSLSAFNGLSQQGPWTPRVIDDFSGDTGTVRCWELRTTTDNDGDGLDDGDEAIYGSNPNDSDSDDDGLGDGYEVHVQDSSPTNSDTDDDGLDDGDEVDHFTILTDPDSDDDGLLDGEEVHTYGTFPLQADTDSDGLTDGDEVNFANTDPLDPDTDDDGASDSADTNPNDPCDPVFCQPDVLVKVPKQRFFGDDLFSNDGADQAVQKEVKRGKTVVYKLRFQTSAVVPDPLIITSQGEDNRFKVKFVYGGEDVTSAVRDFGISEFTPLSDMKFQVTPKKSAPKGTALNLTVEAASDYAPFRSDTVQVTTKAK